MLSLNEFEQSKKENKMCKHLEDFYINNYFSIEYPNFYNSKKFLLQNDNSVHLLRNTYQDYFIKNIGQDWIANNSINKSYQNNNIREGCIFTLQFDDTGTYLASSNRKKYCNIDEHNIEIWNMQEKKLIKSLLDHKEIVTSVEFFKKHSNFMMSSSLDKTIKLWKDFKCIHTYLDHNDWIRCLGISPSNSYFLSGCVSSVIKGWDLKTNQVVFTMSNSNLDQSFLNTVNSLAFQNSSDNIFLCGLRDGSIKIYDIRLNNKIVQGFKAHNIKLNSVKFNKNDTYLLSSGRDNVARLWDFRNLPKSTNYTEEGFKNCLVEYKGHRCVGYNIETNFLNKENYVITGSEDSYIYIYDIISSELVKKYKTPQKCVNLVKPLPNCDFSFVFSGLENTSIYVWNNTKVLSKEILKNYTNNNLEPEKSNDDNSFKNDDDSSQEMQMKLIEDIMSECGDLILRVFHSNNLTYSSGMNFENLYEIIQKKNDPESMKIINMLNEKFMKRICESLIESRTNPNKEKKKKEPPLPKIDKFRNEVNIKCLKCQNKIISNEKLSKIDQELLLNNLPNSNQSFSSSKDSMNINLKYNDLKQFKSLYQNNELKCNYIFDKFI